MIDRHWDGIASYGQPENTVSLGLEEGLNNTIRVFQRRASGYGMQSPSHSKLFPPSSLH